MNLFLMGAQRLFFLARDKPEDRLVVNEGPCLPFVEKEISKTLMTLLGNVRIAPLTSQVVEAEIQGQSDEVAPFSIFFFSPRAMLPEEIRIQYFVNNINVNGKYLIEIENKSNVSILLSRRSLLGEINFSCLLVGKVSPEWQSSDAQEDEITTVEPITDPNVDAEY